MNQLQRELPERFLRLAHRNWEEDQKLTAYYDRIYKTAFSPQALEQRRFINFGPGSFRHKFWQGADRLYDGATWSQMRGHVYEMQIDFEWNLLKREVIDVPAGSIEVCYCSHLVEHAWDDDVKFFFREIRRILKPGGVFRLVVPDTARAVLAWRRGDQYFYPKQNDRSPAEMLLEWSSLITREENSFYVPPEQADAFLASFEDPFRALDSASQRSDRALQERLGAHVNWFDVPKLQRFLGDAGFATTFPSAYAQSVLPILRDTRYFDKTDPGVSCYVDAVAG